MGFVWSDLSKNARGGTELVTIEIEKRVSAELLDNFQIFPSRVTADLDPNKIRILHCHDLADDPSSHHLGNKGWHKFHRIVFVSNHQMQGYVRRYEIPWSRCVVLQNAVEPIPAHEKPSDKVRLIYTSTPQRGLNILLPVFRKLREKYEDLELEVFSSFEIYGWKENDKPFEALFDELKKEPGVVYHGAAPNEKVREAIQRSHVFAYPSTWEETSCICLLEAMTGSLLSVHPNLGALYETASNWTMMYQYRQDAGEHAAAHFQVLEDAVAAVRRARTDDGKGVVNHLASQKSYTDAFYSWDVRARQWTQFLESLVSEPRDLEKHPDDGMFIYSVGG